MKIKEKKWNIKKKDSHTNHSRNFGSIPKNLEKKLEELEISLASFDFLAYQPS